MKHAEYQVQREDGIALVLVLLVIGALSVIILDLNYTTRVNLHLAENFLDDTRAYFLARGAVEAAIYWIQKDEEDSPDYDAICDTGDPACENAWSLDNPGMEVGESFVELKIRDEDGKVWVNDTKNLFKNTPITNLPPFLQLLKEQLNLADEVLDSIQDWIDTNQDVFRYGAESDHYQSLDPPYDPRNGPMLDLSELLMVKGIDNKIYYGKNDDYPLGLNDIFTVYSGGKINVNTAPSEVLSALGQGIDGVTIAADRGAAPFKTKEEFVKYLGDQFPGASSVPQELWDVKSAFFSAYVTVRVHKVTKFVHAVLQRKNKNVSIVYWREG
ncbi:MAG: type II secretion system minor pseudopilin GspK [bacterium]